MNQTSLVVYTLKFLRFCTLQRQEAERESNNAEGSSHESTIRVDNESSQYQSLNE